MYKLENVLNQPSLTYLAVNQHIPSGLTVLYKPTQLAIYAAAPLEQANLMFPKHIPR